jgi:hypothetical protein
VPSNNIPRIKSVAAEGATVLKVKWRGGSNDRIDLAGWIATGSAVLVPLKDPSVFSQPRVVEYGTAVAWGDDDDLMIDAAHLELIAAEQQPFGAAAAAKWQRDMALSNGEAADLLGISPSTWASYKAGARIPETIGMLCRAVRRDPILLHAHYRPRRVGRPRKTA